MASYTMRLTSFTLSERKNNLMRYIIVELEDKGSDGLVGHSVTTPYKRLAEFIPYDEARALVESQLQDGDTVTERYQSSGNEVSLTAAEFRGEQERIREWDRAHS